MKKIIYLVVLLLVVACTNNKDYPNSIKIGDTDGMLVTEFDKTFNGVWVGNGEVNTRTVSFDIDNDGENDFHISSTVDTVYGAGSFVPYYSFSVKISTYTMNISQNISPKLFESSLTVVGDTLINGVTKTLFQNIYSECDPTVYDDKIVEAFTNSFIINDEITVNQLSQSKNGANLSSGVNIYKSSNFFISNPSTYSLSIKEYNYTCLSSVKNESFFIAIYKSDNNFQKLGWIELEILEENTVHLIRTAIQN